MSRNLSLYLTDILTSISKIQRYTAKLSYEELLQDKLILDAVVHNLLIIGEATKQIPDSLRSNYPQMQWKEIAGMKDIIAHAYFSINTRIVWNVIQQDLQLLNTFSKMQRSTREVNIMVRQELITPRLPALK